MAEKLKMVAVYLTAAEIAEIEEACEAIHSGTSRSSFMARHSLRAARLVNQEQRARNMGAVS